MAAVLNTLRSNILSNFASKAVQALGMLVFTPIYLRLLGQEAFGMIGLWTVVRSFLTLLDFGMGTTLNREIAAARVNGGNAAPLWNTLRTLETVSWAIAALAFVLFGLASSWIGHRWLNLTTLSPHTVSAALVFLGGAAAFQLPTILYQGGLTGLERQVWMNGVIVVFSLVRDLGAVLALHLFPTTILTFFVWQSVVSGAQCVAQRTILRRAMPPPDTRPRVEFARLREFGRFTAGTGLISLTVMFLGLADGVLLPRFVPLASYAVFTLSQSASGAILILVSPLTTAAFPRFVREVVAGAEERFVGLFHEFSQFVSVAVFPLAAILAGFPRAVLHVWTGKPEVVREGGVTLATVALATALNALLYLPLQAQYAVRWTSLTLVANTVSAVLFVPTIVVLASRTGIEGAALALLALMAGQFIAIPPLMFRRILRGEATRWYARDLLLPALPAVAFALVTPSILPLPAGRLSLGLLLFALWLVLVVATLLCAPLAQNRVRALVVRRGLAA